MAEGNYLVPGCLRTNEHVRTNSVGLCLKTGVVPLQITGAVRFLRSRNGISADQLAKKNPDPDEEEIKDAVGGHICRCAMLR